MAYARFLLHPSGVLLSQSTRITPSSAISCKNGGRVQVAGVRQNEIRIVSPASLCILNLPKTTHSGSLGQPVVGADNGERKSIGMCPTQNRHQVCEGGRGRCVSVLPLIHPHKSPPSPVHEADGDVAGLGNKVHRMAHGGQRGDMWDLTLIFFF